MNKLIFLLLVFASVNGFAAGVIYVCNAKECEIKNEVVSEPFDKKSEEVLRGWAKSPLGRAVSKNAAQVTGLNLEKITAELDLVQYRHIAKGYVAPQGRLTGFKYVVETKTVFLTSDAITDLQKNSSEIRELILLHESLGALGYVDDDYQYSALILALTKTENKDVAWLRPVHLSLKRSVSPKGSTRIVENRNNKNILSKGGSTEVGGGGDWQSAWLKVNLVTYLIANSRDPQVLNFAVDSIRIETVLNELEMEDRGISYLTTWPITYENFTESVAVYKDQGKNVLLIATLKDFQYPLDKITEHTAQLVLKLFAKKKRDEKNN